MRAPGPLLQAGGALTPLVTVLHAHGRKAGDVAPLSRGYAIARGAYAAKFILRPDTRRCHLRYWCRHLASWSRRPAPYRRECFYEIREPSNIVAANSSSQKPVDPPMPANRRSTPRRRPHLFRLLCI